MDWIRDQLDRITDWIDGLKPGQRQAWLVGLLLLGAVIMAVLIYLVFFRPLFVPTGSGNTNKINLQNNNGLPLITTNNANRVVVNGTVTLPTVSTVALGGNTISQVIYDNDAQDVTLANNGKDLQYYDPVTGKFYRIDANGQIVEMSDQVFKGVQQVTWSNAVNKAVLELQDGFKVLYDFTTKKQYTLHKDMQEFDFSPDDSKISFKFMSANVDERWLGTANIDGSGAFGIEPLGDNADLVIAKWSPSNQAIGVLDKFVGSETKEVIPIGLKGENFKAFTVAGRGFNYEWSPSGNQMLYSTYTKENNYTATLHIVDAIGDTIGNNNISLNLNTSVDKCTFTKSGNTVYCAVPVNPPVGTGIAPELLDTVAHDLYKVDLTTGKAIKIATPSDANGKTDLYAPSDLFVDQAENVLYYRESTTGKLRRVLLK